MRGKTPSAWQVAVRLGFWALLLLGAMLVFDGASGGHLTAALKAQLLSHGWLLPEHTWAPGR